MTLTAAARRRLALQEVHAAGPQGLQAVMTLELHHPSLTETVRVVADHSDLEARLEDDAPRDPGAIVTFTALAFQAAPPERADGRWPEIALRLDGAAALMEPHLEAALLSDAPITLIWREYIRQTAEDGPGRVIRGFELDTTASGDAAVTASAGVYGLDGRFGLTYDAGEYPGLV